MISNLSGFARGINGEAVFKLKTRVSQEDRRLSCRRVKDHVVQLRAMPVYHS